MKLMIMLIFPIMSHAGESWFCIDESGKRNDNVISACGVGEAPTERLARADALNQAIEEFATICKWSDDCVGKPRSVEPKRMTCKESAKGWKCYRLIEVTILEGKTKNLQADN